MGPAVPATALSDSMEKRFTLTGSRDLDARSPPEFLLLP